MIDASATNPHKANASPWRRIAIVIVLSVVGLFLAANIHLVYVAFSSQPDCVPHAKSSTEGADVFTAAKSSC